MRFEQSKHHTGYTTGQKMMWNADALLAGYGIYTPPLGDPVMHQLFLDNARKCLTYLLLSRSAWLLMTGLVATP